MKLFIVEYGRESRHGQLSDVIVVDINLGPLGDGVDAGRGVPGPFLRLIVLDLVATGRIDLITLENRQDIIGSLVLEHEIDGVIRVDAITEIPA